VSGQSKAWVDQDGGVHGAVSEVGRGEEESMR